MKPQPPKVGESFFASCERDEEGHCLPGAGSAPPPTPRKKASAEERHAAKLVKETGSTAAAREEAQRKLASSPAPDWQKTWKKVLRALDALEALEASGGAGPPTAPGRDPDDPPPGHDRWDMTLNPHSSFKKVRGDWEAAGEALAPPVTWEGEMEDLTPLKVKEAAAAKVVSTVTALPRSHLAAINQAYPGFRVVVDYTSVVRLENEGRGGALSGFMDTGPRAGELRVWDLGIHFRQANYRTAIVHEMGHAFDYATGGRFREGLARAVREDGHPAVTTYGEEEGRGAGKEGFAEAYAMYATNPGYVKRRFPHAYAYLKEKVFTDRLEGAVP